MSFHNHDSEDFHKKFGKRTPSTPQVAAKESGGKTFAEIFEKANIGLIWQMSQTMDKEEFIKEMIEKFEIKDRIVTP